MKSTLFSVLLLSVSSQSFAACEAEYQEHEQAAQAALKGSRGSSKSLEERTASVAASNRKIEDVDKALIREERYFNDTAINPLERLVPGTTKYMRSGYGLQVCLLKNLRTKLASVPPTSNTASRADVVQPTSARIEQARESNAIKKQQRNPQTISDGPVSVTLTPTSSTSNKCYDIAYENRGDKNVDVFIKLTLTNNKTGEKGTSVWLGENTQFDGIFGSANTNRLNPKTQMDMSRTGMYNNWLMAKNFIFNNQPSDLYGFNNTVESCDDITAEIPSGGLKWNENAYQRHYDACSSPIKSNRPVGC